VSGGRFTVILLQSTSHAIRGESVLTRAGVKCRLVPVPRQLSSDCGVCLRLDPEGLDRACQVLQQAHVAVESVHTLP